MKNQQKTFTFPDQSLPHEATWLQWPHPHTYGNYYQTDLQNIYVQIAASLCPHEIVRIIVYNQQQKAHVSSLLKQYSNIQYFVWETDDIWIRDNGPIFAYDNENGQLVVQNWGFNGWGNKTKYQKCAKIPQRIAQEFGFKVVDLKERMINEGGSVLIDGKGVMMVCQSSTLNDNRNPGLQKSQAQQLFKKYYGVQKIIWLQGVRDLDITDGHVDYFAKLINDKILLTLPQQDLKYIGTTDSDIQKIYNATNIKNEPYKIVKIPLSKRQMKTKLVNEHEKGSYINYYIGNKVVLVPIFQDQNDKQALQIIQSLYQDRKVIPIDCAKLCIKGGVIHCITQQQPVKKLNLL